MITTSVLVFLTMIKRHHARFHIRFRAVALLSLLALASVIGTVLQQNQAEVAYVVEFGPFWHQIFSHNVFD